VGSGAPTSCPQSGSRRRPAMCQAEADLSLHLPPAQSPAQAAASAFSSSREGWACLQSAPLQNAAPAVECQACGGRGQGKPPPPLVPPARAKGSKGGGRKKGITVRMGRWLCGCPARRGLQGGASGIRHGGSQLSQPAVSSGRSLPGECSGPQPGHSAPHKDHHLPGDPMA